MKKASLLMLAMLLVATTMNPVNVKASTMITRKKQEVTVKQGHSKTYWYDFLSSEKGGVGDMISVSSSNKKVATVKKTDALDFRITGKKAKKSCTVTVKYYSKYDKKRKKWTKPKTQSLKVTVTK